MVASGRGNGMGYGKVSCRNNPEERARHPRMGDAKVQVQGSEAGLGSGDVAGKQSQK